MNNDVTTTLKPTLTLDDAATSTWDVIILGAGLAGSATAHSINRQGLSVLLVDKAHFPRSKVCGCCINTAAIDSLRAMGLDDLLSIHGAVPLTHVQLMARRRAARIKATLGVSLSRKALDAGIIRRAMQGGTAFLPGVSAQVEAMDHDARRVTLRCDDRLVCARARIVIVADGLGGRSLETSRSLHAKVDAHSHMGIATIIDGRSAISSEFCGNHTVMMACGKAGYVGMVRLEDGSLNIASALSPSFIKSQGGTAQAVRTTLAETGLEAPPPLDDATWMGTPLLTRQRSVPAAQRLFVLGDAAGYVEPITGEGMAWALSGARLLAPLAAQAAHAWDDSMASQWAQLHRAMIGKRQWSCRLVSSILRRPLLTGWMLAAARLWPRMAGRTIERMHAPFSIGETTWA